MAKRMLGWISLLMGVTILAWFLYNMVWPTREFRRSFRSVVQLIVPAAMIWYGWRWLTDGGPGIETLQIDANALELTASVHKARQTMPSFPDAVRRHEDGAYIKFAMVTDAGVTEHLWAYVHLYADGVFNVSLANTPYTQSPVHRQPRDVRQALPGPGPAAPLHSERRPRGRLRPSPDASPRGTGPDQAGRDEATAGRTPDCARLPPHSRRRSTSGLDA